MIGIDRGAGDGIIGTDLRITESLSQSAFCYGLEAQPSNVQPARTCCCHGCSFVGIGQIGFIQLCSSFVPFMHGNSL